VITLVYINDGLFLGADKGLVDSKKCACLEHWECHDTGDVTDFLAVCYSPPHIPEISGNSNQNIQTPGGIAQGLKNESEMSGNSRWISGVVVVAVVAAAAAVVVVAATFTNKKTTFVWGSTRIFV